MSSLSTLPKGDSAWLLRKAIERIMEQVSVLETNIGSSTTGNSANTEIIFNDNGTLRGDAGLVYNKTTDTLTAGAATITGDLTVDTSTLKVDSANDNVIVGATSAIGSGRFSVQADLSAKQAICAKNSAASYSATNNFIRFTNSTDSTVGGITHPAVTSLGVWGVSDIQFLLSGAGTLGMTLNSTANLVLKGGTVGASGVGVTFPATQVASSDANCLDDYEEGTWVPSVGGTSTYTTQTGSYIKVGRLVTVSFDMAILLLGTGSTTSISGLPFVVGSATSPKFEQCNGASGYFGSLAVNVYSLSFNASANTSTITSISMNTLGGTANVNPAIYGNATRVQGTVTYMATA